MSQNINLLVHIGPLREESETLLKHVNHVTLLAPFSQRDERQQVLAKFLPALHIAKQPITPNGGEAVCSTYTLKDFNSLAPASELTSLYPGLGKARQKSIDTQTLPQALEQAGLNQVTFTHLIIEQPEIALSLLEAFNHSGLLDHLTNLWVRTSPLRLYEGMATSMELVQWCEQHGFEVTDQAIEDPDFFLLGFTRNPLYNQLSNAQAKLAERDIQLSQLTEERDVLKKRLNQMLKVSQQHQKQCQESEQKHKALTHQYKEIENQLQSAEQTKQKIQKKLEETYTVVIARKQQAEKDTKQITALQAQLTTQQAQAKRLQEKLTASEEAHNSCQRYFTNLQQQHEKAHANLIEIQQQLKTKDATIATLREQLEALQQSNERFGQLESKLESLFGEQRNYIEQTTTAVSQHVTQSARQQRDERALTHYLQHGQRPVSPQLAPDYAIALLEHYDTHRPDVVVIFGSEHTTELLAQSIVNVRAEQPQLTSQTGQSHELHNEVTISHDDLPQAIVSIQHKKAASNALKERLKNKRLSHAVSVIYAPWGECQTNDQTALFYAAESTLQRLNQWLPEDARILIIVGETLPEAGNSREIAMSILLRQLPTQQLDIILEGNGYPQESELTTRWNALLETRQRSAKWLTLPNTLSIRIEE